jgi:methylenetetrahydrofolate reductase (NADPH)
VPEDRTAAEGARLAAETVQQVAAIPGVAGVHLLVAGNEQAVPGILDAAGIHAGAPAVRISPGSGASGGG